MNRLEPFATILVLLFIAYAVWFVREPQRVSAFCSDIHVGTTVSELPAIASRHGINRKWLGTIFLADKKTWFFAVPVLARMGEFSCDVEHDGQRVLSVHMR